MSSENDNDVCQSGKTLIIYYSKSGNTKEVAQSIASTTKNVHMVEIQEKEHRLVKELLKIYRLI